MILACSKWTTQQQDFKNARALYRASAHGRSGSFLEHLAQPFPKFACWLYNHFRILKDEKFPMSSGLECLSCRSSENVTNYNAMWAYGAHLVATKENCSGYVTFDSGMASIPPEHDSSLFNVGMIRDIILVSSGKLSCVFLEGSWIKSRDQGWAVFKRDQQGFWIFLFHATDAPNLNPYVYPVSVLQVLFMEDSKNPD